MVGHYQTGLTTYQRKLSRSTNGGASWTTTTVAGSGPLRDVLMFSDSNWIAVGDNETILRTANGGVSWTGHTSLQRPQVSLTAPAQGDHLTAMPVSIAGTSTDVGVGVASVEYQVKRADGKSLDGASGWATTDTWLQAQTSDGWRHWTANWTPDALTLSAGMSVEIRARATDALGATSAAIQPIVMTNQSVVDTVAPTVTFTSPSAYFSKSVSQLRFVGTASDSVSGLSETRMSIMRSGRYWDHDNRSWTASETWIPASALGSSSAWAYTWLLDATTKNGTAVATVTVESEDRAGNVRRVTSIARPKTKPYLTYPAATYRATSTGPLLTGLPKYARYGKYYYAVGYAKHTPSHSVGVKAGVLEAYRYEKQRNGTYKWIRRKTWTAPAYTLGRYRVRITLPRGTWRLRIVHAEDAVALSGVSSMRTIYVR